MKALFQVTLVRRVFFALVAAFGISWLALMAQIISDSVDEKMEGRRLAEFQASVMHNLRQIDTPALAGAYLRGAVEESNRPHIGTRHATIAAYLTDQDGRWLYSNLPNYNPLVQAVKQAKPGPIFTRDGFLVLREDTGRWSLTVATHRHTVLGVVLDDWAELSIDLLLVFPIMLIPVWIAVSRGLDPLRRLSQRIAAKGDDLSPLDFDPRYAELKPLAAAIDGLLAQLRGKLQRELAFVQDAAHELRTPIAVISAQAHILSLAADRPARIEAESRMDHAVARAAHLIQQLLNLAQVDGGNAQRTSIVDVAALTSQTLEQLAQHAIARQIDLRLEAPDALRWPIDLVAFQSILHNLLDNAIKYANAGGSIVVTLRGADGRLMLSIADDGPGIAEHDLPYLFERFYRGQGHDVAGAGLGLAIVKQAAAGMGGSVKVVTGLDGRGVCFKLVL